jgi:LPXTG-motif cell wall-anchored protein
MYGKTVGLGSTAAGAALAYTGADVVWLVIAGFTLLAAGVALLRILPRSES